MQLFRHQLRRMFEPSRMRGAAIFVLFTTGWIVVALSSVQTSAEAARPPRRLRSLTSYGAARRSVKARRRPRKRDRGPRPFQQRFPRRGRSSTSTASPATTRNSAPPDLRSTVWTSTKPGANAEVWERVIAKLRAGSMPPPGRPRPDAATYRAVASSLETEIDRAWAAHPNPGRINAVHRLNRTEYNNAIRDLFALDLDVKSLLPGDETADGSFDNFADVLSISTAHLERYLSVARQVTRLATGLPPASPGLETFEIPLHVVQDDRQSEDLPFGSRGGIAIRHHFPVDGEYLIKVRLRRQYQDYIMGMGWPQQLDVRLDGKLLKRFTVGGEAQGRPAAASYAGDGEPGFAGDPEWEKYMQIGGDAGLEIRVPVEAGPRVVGVSFVRELWEPEGLPQPLQRGRVLANDQVYMDYANVGSVQIGGPYDDRRAGEGHAQPSRDFRLPAAACGGRAGVRHEDPFEDRPARLSPAGDESGCADAARRSSTAAGATAEALTTGFNSRSNEFSSTRTSCCASIGIRPPQARPAGCLSPERSRSGLALVVFPVEQHPRRALARPGRARTAHETGDPGKGSAANAGRSARHRCARGRFRRPVVESAPRRRSGGRSGSAIPTSTRVCCRRSSRKRSCSSPARCARIAASSICLSANYTFVNERLARHYGIPGIYGSRFRRVTLPNHDQRGGLLGARCAAGDDVLSRPHVAGPARQMAAGQYLRRAGTAAASRRGHQSAGGQAGRRAAVDPRAAGAAPAESRVRTVVIRSSIRWGSRWRISTSSAGGGPLTNRASRSTRAAPR